MATNQAERVAEELYKRGGSAFPFNIECADESSVQTHGMSQRFYAATHIAAGIMASMGRIDPAQVNDRLNAVIQSTTALAYMLADELIAREGQ